MRGSLTLLRTSTFRLAAFYLTVFAVSVAAILGYVYYNTAGLLERQTDETIQAEVQALADQYRLLGLGGILETVRRRGREQSGAIYLFADPQGHSLAGNLDALPSQATTESGWIEFPFTVRGDRSLEQHQARAFHTDLPGNYHLLVGRDVEASRQFASLIRSTLFWALAMAPVLGLGGGLLMSRNFLRRIDLITQATRAIMAGDLSGRMPAGGTGDELDRLARSLNEMLDQIERLMAGMREVSSNVAHDLRTPLARLRARAEAALRNHKPEEHREALAKTIEEADRLLHTFNALLSIARAESGQARDGLEAIDAADVVKDVAELHEPIAEEQGGRLSLAVAPHLEVRADRQLLAQAVSNLIDNALKYGVAPGEAGPRIDISARRRDDAVEIVVADHGPGIPEADRERVVERFVRLDESRSRPGNGLGLSLVAGVMKLHGGRLVLEDNAPGLSAKLIVPQREAR